MEDTKNQEKTSKKASKKPKGTQFAFLLYPENLPQNWEDELEALGLRCAISPLHDRDVNKDGTPKKPHYHGIIVAKNPITTQAMRNKLTNVLGKSVASQVQFIKKSILDAYAYFTHSTKQAKADKKFQYDEKEIKLLNGFDVQRYETPLDEYDKWALVNEIIDAIIECEIKNVVELDALIKASYEQNPKNTSIQDARKAIAWKYGFIKLYLDGAFQEGNKAKFEQRQANMQTQAQQTATTSAIVNSTAVDVLVDAFKAIRDGKTPRFPKWVEDVVDQQDKGITDIDIDLDNIVY